MGSMDRPSHQAKSGTGEVKALERATAARRALAEAGRLLAGSLDYEATVRNVAGLALPDLGSWSILDLLETDGSMRRAAIIHPDPEKQAIARKLEQHWPPERDDPLGLPVAARTRQSEVCGHISDETLGELARGPENLARLRELGIHSFAVVPLIARDHVLGAITFVAAAGKTSYTHDDLELAEELAALAALAVDNARLYAQARGARREAIEKTDQIERHLKRAKTGERELHTSKKRLRTLLRVLPVGVVISDANGGLIYANEAAKSVWGGDVLDARSTEEYGKYNAYWAETGDPVEADEWPNVRALRGEEVLEPDELEIEAFDGERRTIMAQAVPIRDADGRVTDAITTMMDITEWRRAESEHRRLLEEAREQAQSANQAKSEFLAVISHELRTPLNAILGYVDLMLMGVPEPLPEDSKEQLSRVKTSTHHLQELIEEVLTFSRVEAGREELHLDRVDVGELVRETANLIEPLARDKGLEFQVRAPKDDGDMETDPSKVRQILLNLLSNAVKFTEEGAVALDVETENGVVRARVEDTGPGIPTEQLESIFDPFWQAGHGHTREAGGTGLGLSVTKSLTELLGGEIDVESELGEGAAFIVELPREVPDAQ